MSVEGLRGLQTRHGVCIQRKIVGCFRVEGLAGSAVLVADHREQVLKQVLQWESLREVTEAQGAGPAARVRVEVRLG